MRTLQCMIPLLAGPSEIPHCHSVTILCSVHVVLQCCFRLFTTDHSYEYLVEEQPIGEDLFHQFCHRDQVLSHCTKFLQELAALELTPDEKYSASARRLFTEYLAEGVSVARTYATVH